MRMIKHPNQFRVGSTVYEVLSFQPVSHADAKQIVLLYRRLHPKGAVKGQSQRLVQQIRHLG